MEFSYTVITWYGAQVLIRFCKKKKVLKAYSGFRSLSYSIVFFFFFSVLSIGDSAISKPWVVVLEKIHYYKNPFHFKASVRDTKEFNFTIFLFFY